MKLLDAYNVLSKNKEQIVKEWVSAESLFEVLQKIKYSKKVYEKEVAVPVLEYFLNITINKEAVGDCPTMRKLVETFLDSGLCVEDVYINCTMLKNIIVETLYDNSVNKRQISEIIKILDANLTRILGIYTKEKTEKDIQSTFHSKLIEEHVALTITDTEGVITYVTDAFCKLSGYTEDELVGVTHSIIRHPDMPDDFFKSMWGKIKKNHTWKGKIKNRKKDGGEFIAKTEIIPFVHDNGDILEYVSIRHDITDRELSNIDPLTGMYNRRYYKKVIKNILQKHHELSIMILDIDHFKKVNDTYGHSFGDFSLAQFSKIISKKLRCKDVCIRWGGEEFVVILPDTKLNTATEIAERIRKTLENTIIEDEDSGVSENIKCSIGVTQFNVGDSDETIFNRADTNLYTAKKNGRNMVISK